MSEMSSLSHEFASTADFSRELNDAVLVLKRHVIRGAPVQPGDDVATAVDHLRAILGRLVVRLDQTQAAAAGSDLVIPEDVFARLESDHRGDRTYFVSDVKRLATSLSPNESLVQNDLNLLDSICTAADASASATFRKLWRR